MSLHPPLLLLLLTTLCLREMLAFQTGAPDGVCLSLMPHHRNTSSKNSLSPFIIATAKPSISQGEALNVMLSSRDQFVFKGILIHAKNPSTGEVIGTWTQVPENAHTLNCGTGQNNGVTHSDASNKTTMSFEWTPPNNFEGNVIFNGTVVQDYSTYWVGIASEAVSVSSRKDDSQGGISTTNGPIVVTTSRVTTTPAYVPTVSPRDKKLNDVLYDGCGATKTCFGFPDQCTSSASCQMAVAVSVKGDRYEFEMIAQGAKWVAVGLSNDHVMGDDSVVECVEDSPGSPVKTYMSWNEGKSNRRIRTTGIESISGSMVDGSVRCKFVREKLTSVEGNQYDLVNNAYYLLIASGTFLKGNNAGIGAHNLGKHASAAAIHLSEVSNIEGASNLFLRLHGAFMLASWIGTASLGILLARYFRQTWVGSQMCGKDQWFVWHRFFMLLTWSLTIVGFVLIFVHLRGWSQEKNPHAILGVITTALAFIQPFLAAFRPHPGTKRRPLFNWVHWFIGNAAHILAIVTIFFASKLSKAELPVWFDWILVAFVAFHVFMHLVFSIAGCASERQNTKRVNSFPMKEMSASRSPLNGADRKQDAPYSAFRKVILALYIIIIVLLTVAVIVIAVLAPINTFEDLKKRINY